MAGPVDFNKNLDFWQQDKWTGRIPVKWHIVKDVPNSQFRHIILENNDNKPVTNSRDTQEVSCNGLLKSDLLLDFVLVFLCANKLLVMNLTGVHHFPLVWLIKGHVLVVETIQECLNFATGDIITSYMQ